MTSASFAFTSAMLPVKVRLACSVPLCVSVPEAAVNVTVRVFGDGRVSKSFTLRPWMGAGVSSMTVMLAGDVRTGSSFTGVMLTAIELASDEAMTPSVMVNPMLVLVSRSCGGL